MPRTKRRKIITLTQTKKKGLETKQKLVEDIRMCLDDYEHIYIFTPHHARTNKLKDMRLEWRGSRFFMGKNKVMALAMGRTPEEELHPNLCKLSSKLVGQCGLFFTNKSKEDVLGYFNTHKYPVAPNCGDIASDTIELKAGFLDQFPHNMEPYLRKLGLPTRLMRGVPELLSDYVVCTAGKQLSANQANLLRALGYDMALFHLEMEWHWSKEDGTFERVGKEKEPETDIPVEPGKKRKSDECEDMDTDGEDEDDDDDEEEEEEEDDDDEEEEA